jgi:uncharacterized protein YbjT (DUF2867 family)
MGKADVMQPLPFAGRSRPASAQELQGNNLAHPGVGPATRAEESIDASAGNVSQLAARPHVWPGRRGRKLCTVSILQTFAVFGGTGFLGRRIVRRLADRHAVRVISRHPERCQMDSRRDDPLLQAVQADINDDASIRSAVTGAFGVVNAVSLYVEHGSQTFRSVHVDAAARVARISRECGITRLVHVSGVGADSRSPFPYIKSRGEGEDAVSAAFPAATIIRPGVMFGPDDALLMPLAGLLRSLPVVPLFGRGRTVLQPVLVDDTAEGIARILESPEAATAAAIYEFGGPARLSYEALLRTIAANIGVHRLFLPMPFTAWHALAFVSEMLRQPVITRSQVDLMRIDSVTSPQLAGFRDLGIAPQGIERVLTGMR